MSRENFGSKLGAVLAAAGSAVGLGNIWRFPIETGRNGGAAFILLYIAFILILGLPVMISEFVIGRRTHSNYTGAFSRLAPGSQWKWVGRMGVVAGFVVLSFYSVVAGWTMQYAATAASGQFVSNAGADYVSMFQQFAGSSWHPLFWLIIFMLLTHFVITRGVTEGIEKWSKVLMPMLFFIILALVVCSVCLPGAGKGLDFLLHPDFSKVDGKVAISALGQAFFSLSLGVGCICTYASYFNDKTNLTRTALNVIAIDTAIALMAGFIIFPAASAAGYQLSGEDVGPSLIFITLPNVFQQALGGVPWLAFIFSTLFYLLLVLAALTTTISQHEIVTSYLSEEYGLTRSRAAWINTCGCIVLGVFCSLSFGPLKDVTLCGMTIFDVCDWFVSKCCMPLGAFATSIFVGWILKRDIVRDEVTNHGTLSTSLFNIILFTLRYIAPVAILAIFLNQFDIL